MDVLLVVILGSILGAALVAWVIVSATNRASHAAITRHFQASEFILQRHRPPPDWLKPARFSWLPLRGNTRSSKADSLAKLDDLIRFFAACSFFEDEWSREQLLRQLQDERAAWAADPEL